MAPDDRKITPFRFKGDPPAACKKKKKQKKSEVVAKTDEVTEKKEEGAPDSKLSKKRSRSDSPEPQKDDKEEVDPYAGKTKAEIAFLEHKRRKLQKDIESGKRPDLLKTHKERIAEFNARLSRMTDHNDMPKIGPG
ncbi:uncharacterized protein B0T15DRAFT_523638 [Chaetomium strumarium]|uniref:DUF1754-domain-containing protein n=1 Tax=Chaetomium strumarium TaxID=1170767 RepID=A0AAJ0GXS5_9PEZI|nr:hypothetical protein B0T15DRAFT_523638 [Chaetomium strumarium]